VHNHVEKPHKQPKNCYNQHGKSSSTTTTSTRQTPKNNANLKQNPEHSCLESLRTQNTHYNNQKKTRQTQRAPMQILTSQNRLPTTTNIEKS
jgi:hypothetical protein